jgi:polysaccharide pyruvyl transferase WcaK-like protein
VQDSAGHPVRIGLWGLFDADTFGDALSPVIARTELDRRIPGTRVRAFSPFGRPTRLDRGERSEALGTWSPQRAAELGTELDCVIVGGGDIVHTRFERIAPCYGVPEENILALGLDRFFIDGLGPDVEERCAVAWNAVGIPYDFTPEEEARVRKAVGGRTYVSVRDEGSARRLEAAGVGGEVEVVPDPAVLVDRCFAPEALDRRLAYLRSMSWLPEEGAYLLVQGNAALLPFVPELAEALRAAIDMPIVTIPVGACHGDADFATGLGDAIGPNARHLPLELTMEDIVAAIRGAAGFVGSSLHGNIVSFVYGTPHVLLHMNAHTKHEGFARMIAAPEILVSHPDGLEEALARELRGGPRTEALDRLRLRADDHWDRLAAVAIEAAARRHPTATQPPAESRIAELERELQLLRRAYEVRSRRLTTDAAAFADQIQAQRLPMKKAEQFLRSRTYRYTSWVRAIVVRLRRLFLRR